MVINVGDALSAYRSTLKGLEGNNENTSVSGGKSFGDVLDGVFESTVGSLKNADKVSIDAVKGKASVNEIVSAVGSAEMALQEIVGIRDKLISAYQELMRSGI